MSGNLNFCMGEELGTEVPCDGHETELWTIKILLHCLEGVVFGTTAPPKISQETVTSIQNILISLRAVFRDNPFLEGERKEQSLKHQSVGQKDSYAMRQTGLGNLSLLESSIKHLNLNNEGGKGSGGPTMSFNDIGFESKTVLRTLVGTQIRNVAKEIINLHRSILEKKGVKCVFDGSEDDHDISEALLAITLYLKDLKSDCNMLDQELEEAREEIKAEAERLETNVKKCSDILDQYSEYLISENDQGTINYYEEYLRKRNENLRLKKLALDMEVEIDSNPPNLVKEMEENFVAIQNEIAKLEAENLETEKLLEKYDSLGPEYDSLLEQYEDIEEKIATKEWVIKQYENKSSDASLFD